MISFRNLLLAVFALFITTISFAQKNTGRYTLRGTIYTTSGNDPEGTTIYIADLKKGALADAEGKYAITNIPAGTYVVEVNRVGHKTELRRIHFSSDQTADFTLEIAITEEHEIIITGSTTATSLKRNPIPVVSLNKTFLQNSLSTNIIDAVAKAPGISAVTTGPNVSKPFIRGLGYNRILTMYDGIRQEGQQWGDEHGIEIDENTVDKAEIIKGPASLIYGSDAIAGVINLLPAKAPAPGVTVGSYQAEYHSNNGLIENTAAIKSANMESDWSVVGTYKTASNYQNKYDGRVYNTGFRETNLTGHYEIRKPWGFSRMAASAYSNLQEIPDGKRDSATRKFVRLVSEDDDEWEIVPDEALRSYKIADVYQHVQHYKLTNHTNILVGEDRIGIKTGFQRSDRREFEDPEIKAPSLFLELNTWTYDMKYYFHESENTSITSGINGMYQQNKTDRGHEFIIPSYHLFDAGPFLYVKRSAGPLEIAGGIRYDIRKFKNPDLYVKENADTGLETVVTGMDTIGAEHLFEAQKMSFQGLSGSVGISYRISDKWNLKANVGRGYRAPNVSEITSNGIHSGAKIYQLGNSDFSPEFNLQQDVGVTFHSDHVTVQADLFNNHIQNYIFNQKLIQADGADSVIVEGYQTFKYVSSTANLKGGELIVDIHPHPLDWLHFENSISMVYGTNKGQKKSHTDIGADAKYLPFIPPLSIRSELRGNFNAIGKRMEHVFVKVQMEYAGRQNRFYAVNDTETSTPAYHLFHASFGADILSGKHKTLFRMSVFGNNLFNTAYQSHMNRLKYFEDYPGDPRGRSGIYNMGRNIGVRIQVPVRFRDNNG